jgi:hypothetical protein
VSVPSDAYRSYAVQWVPAAKPDHKVRRRPFVVVITWRCRHSDARSEENPTTHLKVAAAQVNGPMQWSYGREHESSERFWRLTISLRLMAFPCITGYLAQ